MTTQTPRLQRPKRRPEVSLEEKLKELQKTENIPERSLQVLRRVIRVSKTLQWCTPSLSSDDGIYISFSHYDPDIYATFHAEADGSFFYYISTGLEIPNVDIHTRDRDKAYATLQRTLLNHKTLILLERSSV